MAWYLVKHMDNSAFAIEEQIFQRHIWCISTTELMRRVTSTRSLRRNGA